MNYSRTRLRVSLLLAAAVASYAVSASASPLSPELANLEQPVDQAEAALDLPLKAAQAVSDEQTPQAENAIAPSPLETTATGATGAEPEELSITETQMSQSLSQPSLDSAQSNPAAEQLNLDPSIIEDSPVLQRWLEEVPDVLSDIRNDPSFRTRLRLGYSQFPSTDQSEGLSVGVEDVFLGQTGITLSGDYQRTFDGDRQTYGSDLRYYIRPLGSYVNVAPVVGYRHLETDEYTTDGVNVGVRVVLALSRTGAADIALTQSWVAPGTDEEVGITTLSLGYALTQNLRLSTDLQKQNAPQDKDSRFGIMLEWML